MGLGLHLGDGFGLQISLVVAMVTIMAFKHSLEKEIAYISPMLKFMAFKLLILLTAVQQLVMQLLVSKGKLSEDESALYKTILLAVESALFGIALVPLFPPSDFDGMKKRAGRTDEAGDERSWCAFLCLFNPFNVSTAPSRLASGSMSERSTLLPADNTRG